MSGPRSGWWLGLQPTKPYGQKVDDSQRKTGLLKLEDTMHDGKAKTTDPPQNPHEIHFRMSSAKPSHLHSPTDVLVGGQNGEVYSLNHSPKAEQRFRVADAPKPAGTAGGRCANPARRRHPWNRELGGPALLCVGEGSGEWHFTQLFFKPDISYIFQISCQVP